MLLELLTAANILTATVLPGVSGNDVIFNNHTGLPIIRMEIGERVLQGEGGIFVGGRILVTVTPTKHTMRIVFRGGADVSWKHLDFKGVHEVTFVRDQNKIEARIQ